MEIQKELAFYFQIFKFTHFQIDYNLAQRIKSAMLRVPERLI